MTRPVPADAILGEATASPSAPAVEMRGVTKRFGAVVACDQVDFAVRRGEICGLLGQNGAGKSTLVKILTGLHTPDVGTILINGRPVVISDPNAAAGMGIAMVHQHFSVIEALTVWENVTLGERSRLDKKSSVRAVETISARYGLDIDPHARIGDLTAGQRQRVEIIKCLWRDPSILVLDEPTSVLTQAESEDLFGVLRQTVEAENRAVILISHKLNEILNATDRVTIMRDGAVVANLATSATTARELARDMVGREVSLRGDAAAVALGEVVEDAGVDPAPAASTERPPILQIHGAVVRAGGRGGRTLLDHLDLELHEGEILGLAGVEGNGQAALADLLHGLVALDAGSVEMEGRVVKAGKPGAMGKSGIAVIAEDRHVAGCVLDMTVGENLVLDDLDTVTRGPLISRSDIRQRARRLIDEFEIKVPTPDTPMRSLSGGNQQRVVLARELSRGPKVLVAAQPTHGLDVGGVEYMTERLRAAADQGVAVLLISTELEEILSLADRVAVIHRGRIMGTFARRDADLEQIGMMMGGQAL